ncbi:MAG: hypothetical protein WBG73_23260 [Coleofasciculaceae cyanobacterium]
MQRLLNGCQFTPMTLRFALLNLSFLSPAQWLFIRLTSASPNVQSLWHGTLALLLFWQKASAEPSAYYLPQLPSS